MRSTPRYKLFQPTDIMTAAGTKRVHLLNLSVGGALIYAADPPERGTIFQVRCGTRVLTAKVAWSGDRRFGAAFFIPLTDADLSATIADHDALVSAAAKGNRSLGPI